MKPLDATQPSNAFLLQWTASDNLSGIDYLEIQEQRNSTDWITLPPITGLYQKYWVVGDPGNAYAYRMHGVDRSGNSENYPESAEANTAVPDADVLCYARDSYDTNGNDNSPSNASTIYANGASQIHNFCNPLSPDYQNDEDWVKLTVQQGKHYFIHSMVDSPPTATEISLFAQDGTTLRSEALPKEFGANSYLIWTPTRDETLYICLRHVDGRVIGTNVGSSVSVKTGELTFLPIQNR
jgi:hypothetical protein